MVVPRRKALFGASNDMRTRRVRVTLSASGAISLTRPCAVIEGSSSSAMSNSALGVSPPSTHSGMSTTASRCSGWATVATVWPGETIRTDIWKGDDRIRFRAVAVERGDIVLDEGSASLNKG